VGHTEASDRIWFLHALRAFAVLGVLYSHVVSGPWAQVDVHARYANVRPPDLSTYDSKWDNPLLVPYVYGPLSWPYHHLVDTGAAGVGLFFLISGVLIPMALERRSAKAFLIARFFRIYPVWVAGLVIAGLSFLTYSTITHFPLPHYGAMDWTVNAGLITDWFPSRVVINPVNWTLLVEWKFYFLCAALAAVGMLHRPAAILGLVTLLVALGIGANHAHASGLLQLLAGIVRETAPHLCVTFVGVCIYHRLAGRWSTRSCVLVVAALWALLYASFRYGTVATAGGAVRFASCTAAAIFFLAVLALRDRLPRSRLVNWIANISYPIYAVHYLLGVGVMYSVYALVPVIVVAQAASVTVTLLAATAIHRWVERPANAFGKRMSAPTPRPEVDPVG
jgi:peptidoglycan/LPS O-acetylase OafA/YrhL